MSYYTGTALSPTDLLQKLVGHLVAAGWTQNMSQAEGSGWRAHLSKSGVFVNFRAFVNESFTSTGYSICMNVGTGYASGSAWNAQAGTPVKSGTSTVVGVGMPLVNAGPYLNYHVFTDAADSVQIVLERTAGVFVHLGFGQTQKNGTWTGGAFFHGSVMWDNANSTSSNYAGITTTSYCPGACNFYNSATGFVRADVDTWTGKWLSMSVSTQAGYGYTGKRCLTPVKGNSEPDGQIPGYTGSWQGKMTSDMNGQANFLPVHLWAERDAGGASLLGNLPLVRLSNATAKGFSFGQEVHIGSDTWKVFPNFAVQKVA